MGGFINERDQRAEAHASLVSGLPSLTCVHVHVCMYHMYGLRRLPYRWYTYA